jgi:probable HAF family extracellular repeat protein
MKSRHLMLFAAITLFAALAIPIRPAAQDKGDQGRHHRYKLIDLGTFGGPTGYLCNDPTGGGGACPVLNSRGTLVSAADTSIPNPNYPNGNTFFPIDPFVFHAFQWQDGTLRDLGALPGGYNSFAYGINANGLIAGASENGTIDPLLGVPELNAVLWKDGNITNLGTLDGGYESAALAVNSHSQVAGLALNPDPLLVLHFRAVLWLNGVIQDLGTLGTGTDAFAYFINERGQVAGTSFTNTTTQDPFLWENGTMTDLGTLGGTLGFPNAMNNRGQVAGQSNLAGDAYFHPFLWTNTGLMQDLGTLGGCCGYARWINDAGDVVGGAWTLNDQTFHAFLWRQGAMTDLTKATSECTDSLGINSKRQVVGYSCSEPDALLWENGQEIDLNIFNRPDSGLQRLVLAYNINDSGEIDGLGVPPGVDPADVFTLGHVFALIPCDEKHRDDEGCHEGNSTKEVPLPRPTLREPARPVPSRTLSKWSSRYRGLSCTGSDRGANDPRDAAAPSNPPGSGYCGVDTNDTLTGICIGSDSFQCIDRYDKRQCPPGKKAIAPTNFSCQIRQVTRVDGARNCPVCGGRCVFGRCGLPGCACGKDGFCHRVGGEALKELLWDPQPESAFTNP